MSADWWKRGVIYQIYPRSFQDTNGDGVGDLAGITRRLDYLQWLGVDALWVSPFYPSPMVDFGYDVANYCDVDPLFGSLADFDALIAAAHARGLKLILDFVPNHTSNLHPWFVESRASRQSAKRDWYLWCDPGAAGGPPNNWISDFGGPAWSWDGHTGQYYEHAFLPQQPDLNWRNPEVRAAMHDVMRFWLKRGVDGFRVDVIWHLIKDAAFRDNPLNPAFGPGMNEMHRVLQTLSTDQDEVHQVVAEMRRVLAEFGEERVLIGEIYLPIERLVRYYGEALSGCHMPLNFQLIEAPWSARAMAELIRTYEGALPQGAWPNWVLGNHDRPRIATRVGEGQARIAAMLLLTLRGTPTLYYGDELGMQDVAILPDRVRDPRELRQPGLGLNRDPVRTPMPWSAGANAGFSSVEPWLPLGETARNVAASQREPRSMLSLYHQLLALRQARAALHSGNVALLHVENDVLAYERTEGKERVIVLLNMSGDAARASLPSRARILLSTHMDREGAVPLGAFALRADEGVVLEAA